MLRDAKTTSTAERMRRKPVGSDDDEPDYAVQRLNMLFEHRRN